VAARRDPLGPDVSRRGGDRGVWLVWPGRSSDPAVPINRIEVPVLLAVLALLPPLVRVFCGPVRRGRLPRTVRVVGYLVVLALIAGHAVKQRDGEQLGAHYFAQGFLGSLSLGAAMFAVVLAGYAAAILILTSQRVRLARSRSRPEHSPPWQWAQPTPLRAGARCQRCSSSS
jgi:hypothetical protein